MVLGPYPLAATVNRRVVGSDLPHKFPHKMRSFKVVSSKMQEWAGRALTSGKAIVTSVFAFPASCSVCGWEDSQAGCHGFDPRLPLHIARRLSQRSSAAPPKIKSVRPLKLHVCAQSRHDDRTAVAVIAGIVDVLHSRCDIDSAPHMQRVIRFQNVLAPVAEPAIA